MGQDSKDKKDSKDQPEKMVQFCERPQPWSRLSAVQAFPKLICRQSWCNVENMWVLFFVHPVIIYFKFQYYITYSRFDI